MNRNTIDEFDLRDTRYENYDLEMHDLRFVKWRKSLNPIAPPLVANKTYNFHFTRL